MKGLLLRAVLAAALAGASAGALAHRFHAGITDVSFNRQSGSTELIHTYMAHDIEALLTHLHQRQFDLTRPDDEALLRAYIERQFTLRARAGGALLAVRWVGLTVDAESVVIYREVDGALPVGAVVHDAVLSDLLPGQRNTLNIRRGKAIRTLTFKRGRTDLPLP